MCIDEAVVAHQLRISKWLSNPLHYLTPFLYALLFNLLGRMNLAVKNESCMIDWNTSSGNLRVHR